MNKYPQVYYDLQNDHFCRGRDRDRRDNYDRRDRDRRDGDMDRDGKVMLPIAKYIYDTYEGRFCQLIGL